MSLPTSECRCLGHRCETSARNGCARYAERLDATNLEIPVATTLRPLYLDWREPCPERVPTTATTTATTTAPA